MSHAISIEEASARLGDLVRSLGPGDEIVLLEKDAPIARIVRSASPTKRLPGAWKGKLEILDDGDDAILDHFREYVP
jgi:antitoxin (DNA-binding transcriptional repressor) of toxin-antitoxin stability system